MKNSELDVIIPVSLELDWPSREEIVRGILEQFHNYGFTRFALAAPCGGWRSVGYPRREIFRERAELFRQIKDELAPCGIQCGWWITLTVKSGPAPGWNRMVRMDGSETPFASCPQNPAFRDRFAEDVALFAKIAKPAFIVTEDDFSINAATSGEGCFCQLHLEEFAKRQGRTYSREELRNIFAEKTPQSFALLKQYRELMRDSLTTFAGAVRREVDRESPEIPIGFMQPGTADRDGDSTEAVARALAGRNHIPFVRLYGTFYGGEDIERIPVELYHALFSKQHIKGDFRFYHESDTFPHTRFFTSAASMRAMMTAVYSFGFDGSTLQTQQLLDDANEEHIYGEMFAWERSRFHAIHRIAKQCRVKGVQIHYDPFWGTVDETDIPGWTKCAAHFGLPYTTLDSSVAFLSGTQTAHLSDEAVMRFLSQGLFLDGLAAKILCGRGYGEHLGVEVGEESVTGCDRFDLGGREVIQEEFIASCQGRHMHRAEFFSPCGNGKLFAVTPREAGCEVVTRVVTFQNKYLAPAMTRFQNRLGGRVVVMGMTVGGNNSSSLFNYRRQRLIQELLVWCGDDFAFVKDAARVFAVMNEAVDSRKAGFSGMLTLINLCPDELEEFTIHLPPKWRAVERFSRLDVHGEWQSLDFFRHEDDIEVKSSLEYTRPAVILAEL